MLLVVGTSLLTPGVASMAKILANHVRNGGGLVVYINRDPPSAAWERYIDVFLETDIDTWAGEIRKEYREIEINAPKANFARLAAVVRELTHVKRPAPTFSESSLNRAGHRSTVDRNSPSSNKTLKAQKMPTGKTANVAPADTTRVIQKEAILLSSSESHSPYSFADMQTTAGPSLASSTAQVRFLVVVLHRGEVYHDAVLLAREATGRLRDAGWQSACVLQQSDNRSPVTSPFGL
ncbi:hypothetical protein RhiJN_02557 [Ceratobasidium sp. AG-Ba]|nr:hypothetical protein RhiJN_02557 [Ceratobasidium sp. AG-Ba]QRW03481.1 hypothetical protein RhiLY_02480 [Ceratobasidium sp. AG-Ba]QRW09593.1 hypothetical protein RhiLY_08592 [Ceratobasidium sp. AG-Ba]